MLAMKERGRGGGGKLFLSEIGMLIRMLGDVLFGVSKSLLSDPRFPTRINKN